LVSVIFGKIKALFSKSKLLFSVTKQLDNRYIEHWKTLLFIDDNKSGGNKLRTYRKLKT
jgi:hypothetical protein